MITIDGKNVKKSRERKGWSQQRLADKAGLSKRTIENIEVAPEYRCQPETLRSLAESLGMEPESLLLAEAHGVEPESLLCDALSESSLQVLKKYRERTERYCDIIDLGNLPQNGVELANRKIKLRQLYLPIRVEPEIRDGAARFANRRQTLKASELTEPNSLDVGRDEEQHFSIGSLLHNSRRIVVLGDPGGGKTTLMRWLATALLLRSDNSPHLQELPDADSLPDNDWLPIIVRCRDLDESSLTGSIDDVLRRTLHMSAFDDDETEALLAVLRQNLETGSAILFIDGLDEIAEVMSRARFCGMIEQASETWPKTPMLVTSRIAGYRDAGKRLGRGFTHYRIADLSSDDKDTFIRHWCELTETEDRRERATAQLIDDIHSSDRIERLTASPLMLTTLALVKRRIGKLPHRRSDLYWHAVDVLLNWRPEVGELIEQREAIPQLEYLAYEMCLRGVSRLRQDEVLATFERMRREYPNIHPAKNHSPYEFLHLLETRTSILVDCGKIRHHGTPTPVYEFRHQTFQEYLGARALVDGRFPARDRSLSLAEHISPLAGKTTKLEQWGDLEESVTENWREVLRLCVAYCDDDDIDAVVLAILEARLGEGPKARRARVVLAAMCLADEPFVSDEVARAVLREFAHQIRDFDGQGAIRTGADAAALELAGSKWADLTQSLLVDEFYERESGERQNCGSVWAMIADRCHRKTARVSKKWRDQLVEDLMSDDEKVAVHAAVIIMFQAYWRRIASDNGMIQGLISLLSRSKPAQDAAAWALFWLSGADFEQGVWKPTPKQTKQIDRLISKVDDARAVYFLQVVVDRVIAPDDHVLLLDLLRDKSHRTRRAAAEALGRACYQPALKPLIDLLNDKETEVRTAAMGALSWVSCNGKERRFLSFDLDGRWPWIDPQQLVDEERLSKMAGKLNMHVDDVKQVYTRLARRLKLHNSRSVPIG